MAETTEGGARVSRGIAVMSDAEEEERRVCRSRRWESGSVVAL